MARPIGAGNVRPTRHELSDLRRKTKQLAAKGDTDALAALATHRLADTLEQVLSALSAPRSTRPYSNRTNDKPEI